MINLQTRDFTATCSIQLNVEQDKAYVLSTAGAFYGFRIRGIEMGPWTSEVREMTNPPMRTNIEDSFDVCAGPVFDLDRRDFERFLKSSGPDCGKGEIRTT